MKNSLPWAMFEAPEPRPLSPSAERLRNPLHPSLVVGWLLFGFGVLVIGWFPITGLCCLGFALGFGFFGLVLGRTASAWLFGAVFLVFVVMAAVLDSTIYSVLSEIGKILGGEKIFRR